MVISRRLAKQLTLPAFVSLSSVLVACGGDASPTPAAPAPTDPVTEPSPTTPAPTDGTPSTPPTTPAATDLGATPGQWTWVPIEGAACADGSPTGIGINLGSSKRLVFFFEGGGACWDALTCYNLKTAANIEAGYGQAEFTDEFVAQRRDLSGSLVDRSLATNPFKDDSFVYVPYCTGDVHGGDHVATYGTKVTRHVGRRNVVALLQRIAPALQDADRVVVSGSSAGGFGATLNYWRIKEAFPGRRVDLIDDSGPPLPTDELPYFSDWDASWNLLEGLPPGCTGCATEMTALLPYYSAQDPNAKLALLSYDQDDTIRQFNGMSREQFQAALLESAQTTIALLPNARYFFVKGSSHTMLGTLAVESHGISLASFLTNMQTDGAWQSVAP